MSQRPQVIVTGPNKRFRFAWWATRFALWRNGIDAHYITTKRQLLPTCVNGVIIGGGDDIEPEHYGLTGDAGSTYDPDRDQLEMKVVRCALDAKVPLMGICRGMQLINVVLGGSLFTDIRDKRRLTPNRNSIFRIKKAKLSENTKIKNIIGNEDIGINSLHNQAVDRVADKLRPCAHDHDGFIQGIESENGQFIIGVQWHPEYLPYASAHRKLFTAFSEEVKATAKTLDCEVLPEVN